MKKIFYVLLASFVILACATPNAKFFSTIVQSNDSTYGYTLENPVFIRNADLENSFKSTYYYLSRLRTKENKKLQLINRVSVYNPNYQKGNGFRNRYTGEEFGGISLILDCYKLLPENNTNDTIILYVNAYNEGNLFIPVNLLFEPENVPDKKRSR